jgi:hypothetical protein
VEANIVTTQFTAAAIFVYVMQKMKAAAWFPLLQDKGQQWMKRGASITCALGAQLGISHVWAPGNVPGSHILTIAIPPVTVIAIGAWHWLGQYAMQEVMYQATANRNDAKGAAAAQTSEKKD